MSLCVQSEIIRFSDALVTEIPHLRAYAQMMIPDASTADDEVMETLEWILSNPAFWRGVPHLRVPLFTILRALIARDCGIPRQNIPGDIAPIEKPVTKHKHGGGHARGKGRLETVLASLSFQERETLVLLIAAKFSEAEVAQICGCTTGTVISRAFSGRARLAEGVPGITRSKAAIRDRGTKSSPVPAVVRQILALARPSWFQKREPTRC